MKLLPDGKPGTEIAAILGISLHTAHFHISD